MSHAAEAEAVVFWIHEKRGYYGGIDADGSIIVRKHLVYAQMKGATPPSAVRHLMRKLQQQGLTVTPKKIAIVGDWP